MTSDNLLTAFGVDRRMGRGEIRTIRRGRDVTVAARLESSLWPALWNYWHPVAFSADVTDKPHAAKLLDQRLVLARLGDRLACFRDLCVHRGTPLSLGWIDGEELVCAYHGWCYDAAGACTRIPALPADHPIPRRARAEAFATEERYGIVWVCLGEPAAPIPAFPEADDPAYKLTYYPAVTWRASAARRTENFVDAAHFPWVHENILGTCDHPEVPVFTISRHGEELRYAFEDLPNPMHPMPHRRVYRLHRPFTIHQRKVRTGDDEVEVSFHAVCPNAAKESTAYFAVGRNFPLDPAEEARRFALDELINAQDKPVVESQRPEELPLDLAAELHLKGPDAVAVAYRRFMAELGIDVDAPAPSDVEG
jgi:phenylpropionate dioxygenase-like ring-hydroxylating dioxygenase large terminal subunit